MPPELPADPCVADFDALQEDPARWIGVLGAVHQAGRGQRKPAMKVTKHRSFELEVVAQEGWVEFEHAFAADACHEHGAFGFLMHLGGCAGAVFAGKRFHHPAPDGGGVVQGVERGGVDVGGEVHGSTDDRGFIDGAGR